MCAFIDGPLVLESIRVMQNHFDKEKKRHTRPLASECLKQQPQGLV